MIDWDVESPPSKRFLMPIEPQGCRCISRAKDAKTGPVRTSEATRRTM